MSLSTQKQNQMLKSYVSALQNQNKSRNLQKDILLQQIQNLSIQVERYKIELDELIKQKNNSSELDQLIQAKTQAQLTITTLKNHLQSSQNMQVTMSTEIARLTKQLQHLSSKQKAVDFQQNTKQLVLTIDKLSTQNQQLKNTNTQLQNNEIQLQRLKKQNEEYKLNSKIQNQQKNFMFKIQNQFQINKISSINCFKQQLQKQFEIQKQQIVNQLNLQHQSINQANQNTIKQLQNKIKQLQAKLYKLQVNTSSQLRQLKSSKVQVQGKIQYIEKQKQSLQKQKQRLLHRVHELQLELTNKNYLLSIKNEEGLHIPRMKSSQNGKKRQLIGQSNPTISEIKEASWKNKSGSVDINHASSQVQEQNFGKNSREAQQLKNMEEKYKKEIQELKMKLAEIQKKSQKTGEEEKKTQGDKQKDNEGLKKVIIELTQNSKSLLDRLKSFQQSEEGAVQVNERIEQKSHYHQRSQNDKNENRSEQDLRDVVKSLKNELNQVTSDFRKMQDENKKMKDMINVKPFQVSSDKEKEVNNHSQFRNFRKSQFDTPLEEKRNPKNVLGQQSSLRPLYNSHIHKNNDRFQENQDQFKIKHIKIRNPTDKFKLSNPNAEQTIKPSKSIQRDKWENLQKRIRQLRQQNSHLKQALSS